MAGFKELIDANTSFRESLREQSDIAEATRYQNEDEIIEQKIKFLKLLEAKRCLLTAHITKDRPEVSTAVVVEGNVLEKLGETTEKEVIERKIVKFISTSQTVKQLFSLPDDELNTEQRIKKEECRQLMKELAEEEMCLMTLQEKTEEAETQRNEVLKSWDETLAKLHDKASGVKQNENRSDDEADLPGKKKLQGIISKMDLMKTLIGKLITSRQYDWVRDPANLKPLLQITRENFTADMFDE